MEKSDPGSGINIRIRNTGYLVYEYPDPDAFSMFSTGIFRHILRRMFFGSKPSAIQFICDALWLAGVKETIYTPAVAFHDRYRRSAGFA
jgi:hypothetical protein